MCHVPSLNGNAQRHCVKMWFDRLDRNWELGMFDMTVTNRGTVNFACEAIGSALANAFSAVFPVGASAEINRLLR